MYVQCALDVWTVVDIYGMWIIGPRLYWGIVGIMECLFFPLSWCCTYDVNGGTGSFCACFFCPPKCIAW